MYGVRPCVFHGDKCVISGGFEVLCQGTKATGQNLSRDGRATDGWHSCRSAGFWGVGFRWGRSAQPPATRGHPAGMAVRRSNGAAAKQRVADGDDALGA